MRGNVPVLKLRIWFIVFRDHSNIPLICLLSHSKGWGVLHCIFFILQLIKKKLLWIVSRQLTLSQSNLTAFTIILDGIGWLTFSHWCCWNQRIIDSLGSISKWSWRILKQSPFWGINTKDTLVCFVRLLLLSLTLFGCWFLWSTLISKKIKRKVFPLEFHYGFKNGIIKTYRSWLPRVL